LPIRAYLGMPGDTKERYLGWFMGIDDLKGLSTLFNAARGSYAAFGLIGKHMLFHLVTIRN